MEKSDKNKLWWLAAGAATLLATRTAVRKLEAYDFSGKVVLITGGARGLGLVMARQLAREGARLVLCSRNQEQLDKAKRELVEMGADVWVQTCDVTVKEQVEALVARVSNEFGPIDVLINNAGVIQGGPVTEMTEVEFAEAINIYYWAPIHTTMAVVPSMRTRGGGRILNIASIGGKVAVPHLVPYSAAKFALVGLSEGYREELMQYNISVTTATPGLIRSGSPRNAIIKGQHEKEYALFKIIDSSPLTSMSAEATARKVLNALRYGDASVTTTIPAKVASMLHKLSPGFMTGVMGLANSMLPGEGGVGKARARGYESETPLSESGLTESTQKAAIQNNEL